MKKRLCVLLVICLTVMGVYAYDLNPIVSATTTSPPAKTKINPASSAVSPSAKPTVPVQDVSCSAPDIYEVNPVDVVKNPSEYLNKKISVSARFDKFATLGLDYKPAFRSSETYISFLIFRTDTDKNIPLSEMKLFIKRTAAEKLTNLKEGDKVKFSGAVFSTALGDPWIDVEKLEKIK